MKRIRIAIPLLTLVIAAVTSAQPSPAIGVSFSLEPPYDFFSAEKKVLITNVVTARVVTALRSAFPIYGFDAGTALPHHLEITLGDDPRAAGGPTPAVVFIVRLDPGTAPDSPPLYILYRTPERRGEPVPRHDVFARELSERFVREIEQNRHGFMTTLLQRIVLARTAWPLPANRAFVLPFGAADFADGTQFLIRAKDTDDTTWDVQATPDGEAAPIANMPEEFHHRLRAKVQSPQEALALVMDGRLTPDTVRLLVYHRGRLNVGIERPSTPAPSGESER